MVWEFFQKISDDLFLITNIYIRVFNLRNNDLSYPDLLGIFIIVIECTTIYFIFRLFNI